MSSLCILLLHSLQRLPFFIASQLPHVAIPGAKTICSARPCAQLPALTTLVRENQPEPHTSCLSLLKASSRLSSQRCPECSPR